MLKGDDGLFLVLVWEIFFVGGNGDLVVSLGCLMTEETRRSARKVIRS